MVIEKALGNVFLRFPYLEGEHKRQVFGAVYTSGYFDEIPLRPEDPWDSVEFSDELKLKLIGTMKDHLGTDAWRDLRVRKLGGASGCYAWSFLEVAFSCPTCNQEVVLEADRAGLTMPCPMCGGSITVPGVRPLRPAPTRKGTARKRPQRDVQNSSE